MEITKAEAEAYLAELENVELDADGLDNVAGGGNEGGWCWDVKKDGWKKNLLENK